ncbi:MAG: M20/M25/M40 family metallo-hydrolase [Gemmatimonadota bacterium]
MRTRWIFSIGMLGAVSIPAAAQSADQVRDKVRAYREANAASIVQEFVELLAIPNVASDRPNIERNARQILAMMARRGITGQLLEVDGAPPSIYGELKTPGATKTIVIYAHYDGQPVDRSQWTGDPWTPVLRSRSLAEGGEIVPLTGSGQRFDPENRIYARSASDDKAPIIGVLAALDALKAAGLPPSVNLKLFFEGEEEAGSDHLRAILEKYKDLLAADLWIFCDGPVHQSRRPQIVFGVRGVIGLQLTIYGPARPLHSGHYGNWAPNPNAMMVNLLASMRDEEGKILVANYYDDVRPLTASERAAFASIPPVEPQLEGELRLGRTESAPQSLAERISQPALNIGGLRGGQAGAWGANVIVTRSEAYVDLRLVPDQTPERVQGLVERHIGARGYTIVRTDPDSATLRNHPRVIKLIWSGGYPSVRASMDGAGAKALLRTVDAALGRPAIRLPTLGGSLPLYHFAEVLRTPLVTLPIANHDNNQHAENENLRLKNLWDAIEIYGGVLARLGREWTAVP